MCTSTALADNSFGESVSRLSPASYEHKTFHAQTPETLHESTDHRTSVVPLHAEVFQSQTPCQDDFRQETLPHETQEALWANVQQLHQHMVTITSQMKKLAAIIPSMQAETDGDGSTKASPPTHKPGAAPTPAQEVDEPLCTQRLITPIHTAHDSQDKPAVSEEMKDLLCQALKRVMSYVHDDKETHQHKAATLKDEDAQSAHKTSEDATLWERTKAFGQKKIGILSEKVRILKAKPWYPMAVFFGKIVGPIISIIFLLI
ncbi:hypothetical protein EIL50_02420 [bacterium NHP-B]|nr:hypothetical protein EIL50_02420 [bacterium NHP-B]